MERRKLKSTKIYDDLCKRFPDLTRNAIKARIRRGDVVLLAVASKLKEKYEKQESEYAKQSETLTKRYKQTTT